MQNNKTYKTFLKTPSSTRKNVLQKFAIELDFVRKTAVKIRFLEFFSRVPAILTQVSK
jgi:hypothetical protein